MLNVLNNLNAFAQKPKRQITATWERTGKYEDNAVLLIKSVKNTLSIPKGKSQEVMGVNAKDAVQVIPHYFDAELTLEALTSLAPEVATKIKEANQVMTGEELKTAIKEGSIQKLMPQEIKDQLVSTLVDTEEYPVLTLVMKRDMAGEITAEEYEVLDAEIKAQYSYRKGAKVAKLEGIMGKDGGFSAAAAYAELGGVDTSFDDRACTIPSVEIKKDVEQFTKQLVYALTEGIDFGGVVMHVAYKITEDVRVSKKGQERTSGKKEDEVVEEGQEVVVNNEEVEQLGSTTVEANDADFEV